jgi:hypothetical protein
MQGRTIPPSKLTLNQQHLLKLLQKHDGYVEVPYSKESVRTAKSLKRKGLLTFKWNTSKIMLTQVRDYMYESDQY